jgi:hypothetical protein
MSNPVIFKDLPATFPEKDKYQKPSFGEFDGFPCAIDHSRAVCAIDVSSAH